MFGDLGLAGDQLPVEADGSLRVAGPQGPAGLVGEGGGAGRIGHLPV
jgi:hypothetical protein